MHMPLEKIMDRLGVGRILYAYETNPWFLYDEDKGVTCSAEVRMGPDSQDVEAEIQFIKDEPSEDEEGEEADTSEAGSDEDDGEEDEEGDSTLEELTPGRPLQILIMRIVPSSQDMWETEKMYVKGENYENKLAGWDEKGGNFFRACVESIQMGELPNIDDLIERNLTEGGFWGKGKRGKVGRKSPTIKPAQLLGMKRDM